MFITTSVAIFFFFQAEDGIRYYKVTGVQTCALPILDPHHRRVRPRPRPRAPLLAQRPGHDPQTVQALVRTRVDAALQRRAGLSPARNRSRSEERRVGKERSAQGTREAERKINR